MDWSEKVVHMKQMRLIRKMLNEKKMENCKPIGSLMNPASKLKQAIQSDVLNKDEHAKNRSIISTLIYLVVKTRADLCVAASPLQAYVAIL